VGAARRRRGLGAHRRFAPAQLDENLAALDGPAFDAEELERIDVISAGIGEVWADAS
jgi:hypothetical protein